MIKIVWPANTPRLCLYALETSTFVLHPNVYIIGEHLSTEATNIPAKHMSFRMGNNPCTYAVHITFILPQPCGFSVPVLLG